MQWSKVATIRASSLRVRHLIIVRRLTELELQALATDPRYIRLVRRRSRLGWILAWVVLIAYFGFILLVAFAKPLLARPLAGGATSIGIPVGLGVILLSISLTAIYVWCANREFDIELDVIRRDFRA